MTQAEKPERINILILYLGSNVLSRLNFPLFYVNLIPFLIHWCKSTLSIQTVKMTSLPVRGDDGISVNVQQAIASAQTVEQLCQAPGKEKAKSSC